MGLFSKKNKERIGGTNVRSQTSWSQKGGHKRPGHNRPGHKRPIHKRPGHKRPATITNICFV